MLPGTRTGDREDPCIPLEHSWCCKSGIPPDLLSWQRGRCGVELAAVETRDTSLNEHEDIGSEVCPFCLHFSNVDHNFADYAISTGEATSVSMGVNGALIKDTTTGNTNSDINLAGLSEVLSRPVENTTQDLQAFIVSAEPPSVDTELPMGTNLKYVVELRVIKHPKIKGFYSRYGSIYRMSFHTLSWIHSVQVA